MGSQPYYKPSETALACVLRETLPASAAGEHESRDKKPRRAIYSRSNGRCGIVIPEGPVTLASSCTYAHSDVSPIDRDAPTDSLPAHSVPETYPKQVTIGVIFAPTCAHEPFLMAIFLAAFTRTSFIITPRIVNNGAGFRKTNRFSYQASRFWPLSSHTDTILQPAGSNFLLVIPPDTQG